jgi:acyl-CoA synthetase (AMP-forming)/AMP-acid ligase II
VKTLPEILVRAAARSGDITYLRQDGSESTQTYGELRHDAQLILGGLRVAGVRPGDRVVIQVEDPADYLATFWACLLGGMVAVPLSATAGAGKLERVQDLCGPALVVTRELVPSLRGGPVGTGHTWHPDDVFVILFTSGSTGTPKGVTLTHRGALTMIEAYTRLLGLTAREVSFNWMPLDHVGGLAAFHLRDVYLGCRQVHAVPATVLADPLRWLDLLDRFRATCTWAPNFAYGLVNEELARSPSRAWDLSRLRHILNAGEMIVPRTVRRFLTELGRHGLPPTAMCPSWGMSETTGGVTFSTGFALATTSDEDRFVDVGPPISEARVRIVAGRIQVAGPTVTPGYYRSPELDAAAFTPDGWFDTGDIGIWRDGGLTITGRAKDTIIVNGVNYYCQEIEVVVEEVPEVAASYAAACAVRAGDTEALAIFYCSQLADEWAIAEQWREIRRRVVGAVGLHPSYLLPVRHEAIPRTETGKIRRDQLRQWFADGRFDGVRARVAGYAAGGLAGEPGGDTARRLTLIWRRALGLDRVGVNDDFFDLGGDSLVSMRIVALARADGLSVTETQIVESRTIATLAATLDDARVTT